MTVKIREYGHGDADGLLGLYRSVGHWFEDIKITKEYIMSSSEREDFRFLVAEESGDMLGFVGALFFTGVGRAELGPIAVDGQSRGRGVGSMLVESMMSLLKDRGVLRVTVKVKAKNKAAISFFLAQGFSHEAYLRRYTMRGEDVVELAAKIPT